MGGFFERVVLQPEDVGIQPVIPQIVQILTGSHTTAVIGWSVAFIILVTAIVFIRLMSHIYEKEIERLSSERDKLQTKLLEKGKE